MHSGETWMEMHTLHKHGWTVSTLAREFGLSRNTCTGGHQSPGRGFRAKYIGRCWPGCASVQEMRFSATGGLP